MAEPTAMELDHTPTPIPTLFRTNKKRNYIRRARATSTSPDPPTIAVYKATTNSSTTYIPSTPSTTTTSSSTSSSLPTIQPTPNSDSESNLASILRLRKKQSRPKRGLDIAEIVPKVSSTDPASEVPYPEDEEARDVAEQELAAVVNRFTHQTGQVLDVDKHMVAYIESQMEKRRVAPTILTTGDPSTSTDRTASSSSEPQPSSSLTTTSAFWQPTRPTDRGATLGKLHEVDLGEENKLKNIHRTAEATRRLEDTTTTITTTITTDDPAFSSKSRKRRRRNSQDIQRDKLVEEVLKESKLDLYDDAPSSSPHPSDDEGAADDRIAEKFRREFLDALMSRRRRRGNYQKTKKKDDAKKPRGPKLGGSRSARAAMRESQLAQGSGGTRR